MWDQKLEIFGWKRCFVSIWWTVLPILFCNSLLKQVQVKWPQLKANSSKIIGLKTGYMNDRISSPPFLWNLFFSFFVCQLSTFDEKKDHTYGFSRHRTDVFVSTEVLTLSGHEDWVWTPQPGVVLTRLARIFGRCLRHGFPGIRNLAHLRNIFTSSRNSLLGIMITTFLKTKTCSEMERFFARFLDAFFVGLFLSIAKNPAGWRDGPLWVALGIVSCHGTWAAQVRSAAFSPDGAPEGGSLSWNADGNYTTFSSNEIVRIMHHNRYH